MKKATARMLEECEVALRVTIRTFKHALSEEEALRYAERRRAMKSSPPSS